MISTSTNFLQPSQDNNSRAFQFGQKKFRFETNRACNICIKGASSSRCGLNGLLEKSSPDAKQDMNSMCTSTKGNSLERFMLSDLVQICGILSLLNTRTRRQYKRVHTRTQPLCPLLSVYTRLWVVYWEMCRHIQQRLFKVRVPVFFQSLLVLSFQTYRQVRNPNSNRKPWATNRSEPC